MKDKILNAYLHTALWSSIDENEHPLDDKYDPDDFSDEAVELSKTDIVSFWGLAKDLIRGCDEEFVAHDFWLTRNGHGAGFWDGDYENGDELTEICKQFKELNPYAGDDGKIYFF